MHTTDEKLSAALERMRHGITRVLRKEFPWTKTSLAKEAGISIHTLLKKGPSGEWKRRGIIEQLERSKPRTFQHDKKKLLDDVVGLKRDIRALQLSVIAKEKQLIEYRELAERIPDYERQIEGLRDQLRRIRPFPPVRERNA